MPLGSLRPKNRYNRYIANEPLDWCPGVMGLEHFDQVRPVKCSVSVTRCCSR